MPWLRLLVPRVQGTRRQETGGEGQGTRGGTNSVVTSPSHVNEGFPLGTCDRVGLAYKPW